MNELLRKNWYLLFILLGIAWFLLLFSVGSNVLVTDPPSWSDYWADNAGN